MKTLVLAEKPSVGREIARVLGCKENKKAFIEGGQYVVTWAMGHLIELADPERYRPEWKSWSMETLPMIPERMKHNVIRRSRRQFDTIKSLFNRDDIDHLVIATDAGREGELVARWIMRLAGWKGKTSRLWISSQTDKAIRQGFENLKKSDAYMNLFRAAEARAEADWLIGLNVTRALSCKYDARLSAGRVQTPTLALLAERERQIETFIPRSFWTIEADLGEFTAAWENRNGNTRFYDQEEARKIAAQLQEGKAAIVNVADNEQTMNPPSCFDLTDLQREANRIYGFSAKKTLQILQGLYEHHKIVTYPRTDSRYITKDIVETLPDRLRALADTPWHKAAAEAMSNAAEPGSWLVNDKKVTDHHALIPTEETVNMDRLNGEERQIYELIVCRFIAALSGPLVYRTTKVELLCAGQSLVSRGRKRVSAGWTGIDKIGTDKGSGGERIPDLTKGAVLKIVKAQEKQGQTDPPSRYSEGTLLSAMENPQKFIKNPELKKSIAGSGLGTPATRAEIIEKLVNSYYVERRGRELVPTPRGIDLLQVVPDELLSPELTARWELRLKKISDGKENQNSFRQDIQKRTKELVNEVKSSTHQYLPRDTSGKSCPLCGKPLIKISGRNRSEILVCQALSCGYEESKDRHGNRKTGPREKAMNRKLVKKYGRGEDSGETTTLGALIKAAEERKKRTGRK